MTPLENLYNTRTYSPHILVVGEQPTTQEYHITSFYDRLHRGAFNTGKSRERLLSLGLTWSVSLNLLDPGPWDCELAEARARRTMSFAQRHDLLVVCCGRRVTEAFGYSFSPLTKYRNLFVLPHPKCGQWHTGFNDACKFVKEVLCPSQLQSA